MLALAGLVFSGCSGGSGGGGAWVVAPSATDRFFVPDVRPVLRAQCASCHAGGDATAQAAYPLGAGDEADFHATTARIHTRTPDTSLLLVKATGGGGHPALLARGDSHHAVLRDWIEQGGGFASGTFILQWDPNTEPDIAGYRVLHGTASGAYGPPLDAGNRTTFRLDGLRPGTRYFVAVTAYDTSGHESAPSNEVEKVAR